MAPPGPGMTLPNFNIHIFIQNIYVDKKRNKVILFLNGFHVYSLQLVAYKSTDSLLKKMCKVPSSKTQLGGKHKMLQNAIHANGYN